MFASKELGFLPYLSQRSQPGRFHLGCSVAQGVCDCVSVCVCVCKHADTHYECFYEWEECSNKGREEEERTYRER